MNEGNFIPVNVLLYNDALSLEETLEEQGIPLAVAILSIKHHLKSLTRKDRDKRIALAKKLYHSGMTINEVSLTLRIPAQTIRKWVTPS